MSLNKSVLLIIFLFSGILLFSNDSISLINFTYQINNKNYILFENKLTDYYYNQNNNYNISVKFDFNDNLDKYQNSDKKKENLFRRAEILFFGSLTFATFGGWFFFSVYNKMIYNEPFGQLRREQFLPLYLGSSVVSISVVLSDLFINLKPKIKGVEIY